MCTAALIVALVGLERVSVTTVQPYQTSDDSAALPNQCRFCCPTTPVTTLLPYQISDDTAALPHQ